MLKKKRKKREREKKNYNFLYKFHIFRPNEHESLASVTFYWLRRV